MFEGPDRTPPPTSARVEVDLDADRHDWAVLTLVGPFDGERAVEALGATILDLLLEGHRMLAVDARRATPVALGTGRTLVAGGELARRCDGCLVVTVADHLLAASLRALDGADAYEVVAPRT